MKKENQVTTVPEVEVSELQKALQVLSNKNLTSELIKSREFIDAREILDNTIKVLKAVDDASKSNIKKVVKEHFLITGENTIETDKFNYTYKTESTRTSFDTDSFKVDYPDLYPKYLKISAVSDSVTVTKVKEKTNK